MSQGRVPARKGIPGFRGKKQRPPVSRHVSRCGRTACVVGREWGRGWVGGGPGRGGGGGGSEGEGLLLASWDEAGWRVWACVGCRGVFKGDGCGQLSMTLLRHGSGPVGRAPSGHIDGAVRWSDNRGGG